MTGSQQSHLANLRGRGGTKNCYDSIKIWAFVSIYLLSPQISCHTDITAGKRHCVDLKLHINTLPKKKHSVPIFTGSLPPPALEALHSTVSACRASPTQRDFGILLVFPHISTPATGGHAGPMASPLSLFCTYKKIVFLTEKGF